jgi:hypothetical protein
LVVLERRLDLGAVKELVLAGWTGRDVAAVEAHIRELEAVGVKRPKTTPIFYRAAASLLTHAETIEVVGEHTSGEVEYILFALADELWVGLGSDHTDRKLEAVGVSLSKQICAKPVAHFAWRFEDVRAHWDQLILRSFVTIGRQRRLYQEGAVSAMRRPEELMKLYAGGSPLEQGTAMFGGTLVTHGGIATGGLYEMELEDPVLDRKLSHRYLVISLPDEG